ncbi:MAG: FAD-dependent oxidoreductase [Lachnospiraceae bacterium]|jgi:2,4-dienoyl-CoA reductase-like NADH-dependent reductase (Old Yellow Enzyme family)/thioredoxin reductase|nr:FAD-dependent oxidoreductase [Lachnospiraceae bacterium]
MGTTKEGTAGAPAGNKRYRHLLSPLKIGGVVLKNRTSFPVAPPHFLQGPETFPAEGFMTFYAGLARSGAAYVYLDQWNNPLQRTVGQGDSLRMQFFDMDDPSVHNYFSQLADDVHYYGGKLCLGATIDFPQGYSFNGGPAFFGPPMTPPVDTEQLPRERLEEVAAAHVEKIRLYRDLGYDMVSIRLEPYMDLAANARTDEYGGQSLANSLRFPLLVAKKVKEAFGRDFLIDTIIAGESLTHFTTADVCEMAKLAEGLIDIIVLRERDVAASHPTSFTFTPGEHPVVGYARQVKASGAKVVVAVNGGFQDPDELEKYLADGDCDMISMGRAFFADFDYMRKIENGDADDITPCLFCNKCHGTLRPPWLTYCSVNPVMGNEHKLHRMVRKPDASRKVCVIGGGPAGMYAAIYAARNGHSVTLYEAKERLGGQLAHGDYFAFKWTIARFAHWQERQLEKLGVDVRLGIRPTPERIEAEGYDVVIAATGAAPGVPGNIEGLLAADGSVADGIWLGQDTWGRVDELGKRVVVVGGSESGMEHAMYFGENGHEVTVLTRQGEVASDAAKLHYITMSWVVPGSKGFDGIRPEWAKEKYNGIKCLTNSTTVAVTPTSVTYKDADGVEHVIECDSVVICGGVKPRQEEAIAYAPSAPAFKMAGDVVKVGNIQTASRSAFAAANQI